jgi:hypothetical protein
MNPQTNGNPFGAKSKQTKPHFVTVYETYQKNFDEAIENALQHPIWRNQPPETINAIDGNKVVFEMNHTFSIMAIVGIIESPYSEFFNWRVVVSIVINKTGEFHKTHLWTRKDKMRLTNVGQAMMVGCGDRNAERSWGVSANTMTFMKQANEEDMKVVDIIRQQELDKLSSIEKEKGE